MSSLARSKRSQPKSKRSPSKRPQRSKSQRSRRTQRSKSQRSRRTQRSRSQRSRSPRSKEKNQNEIEAEIKKLQKKIQELEAKLPAKKKEDLKNMLREVNRSELTDSMKDTLDLSYYSQRRKLLFVLIHYFLVQSVFFGTTILAGLFDMHSLFILSYILGFTYTLRNARTIISTIYTIVLNAINHYYDRKALEERRNAKKSISRKSRVKSRTRTRSRK